MQRPSRLTLLIDLSAAQCATLAVQRLGAELGWATTLSITLTVLALTLLTSRLVRVVQACRRTLAPTTGQEPPEQATEEPGSP